MLTQSRLKELVKYNDDTGVFIWIVKRRGTKKNKMAGHIKSNGYLEICIDGQTISGHRLAWLYMYGYLPENYIDHINRNRSDNKISNLRVVTQSCNMRNAKGKTNNKSGINGVYFAKNDNMWAAQITVNCKNISLGCYKDFDSAVCARLAGEQALGWVTCNAISNAHQYVKTKIQGQHAKA